MAKRRREPDSDDTTTETAEYKTVFVDTSLDTHLAMLVSKSDTVKRRANFYDLPDTMLVWSAFHGVKKSWFLSVDASNTPSCHLNRNPSALGTSDCMKMDVRSVDNNCRADINRIQTLRMSLPDGVTEKNVVSEMIPGFEVGNSLEKTIENSLEKTIDNQKSNVAEEKILGTKSPAKKKRKKRHTEGSEGMNLCEQQGKPTTFDTNAEVSGVRNDQSVLDDRVAFEGTSVSGAAEKSNLRSIVNCQNHLVSDERKEDTVLESMILENLVASKKEHELGQDVPTDHSGGVSIKVPDLSAGLMDASGAIGDVNPDGTKRKKKKAQKTAAKIQGTIEQTLIVESIKPHTETHKSEEKEEPKLLSLDRDHEVRPSSYKASDHATPDLTLKEPEICSDSKKKKKCREKEKKPANANLENSGIEQTDNGVRSHSSYKASDHSNPDLTLKEEPEISSGSKKKRKRAKKSATANLEKSGIEQTDNGVRSQSGLPCFSTGHIPEETDKEESMYHKGEDTQLKLLTSSTLEGGEKVQGTNGNGVNFVMSSQTEQTLEDVATGRRKRDKKTQNSAGNGDPDFPAVEKENQFLELNQVEKDSENTENMEKIACASDVQENSPVKDQNVGVEALTTEGNSISNVNSKMEEIHVASSQVLPHKSEEKLEKMHEIAVNTDDLARTSENQGEGINFKQYFVPDQDKVDSRASDNESRVRNDSGKRQGPSAQNSDGDEVIPNSSRRSSRLPENGVEDSSPSEMPDTNLQKPKETLAGSSCPNKKNDSFEKSSSKRSEKLPGKRGNKKSQLGLNVTKKLVMRTPQKKSLLAKPGAIFQDNSGESSGDENGTAHSDGSTRSPSDSSSDSGSSVGESDLSQDSTRNGSNDAQGRSTGGENASKLDISASENMTMHMILRSSKRFKKAKLLASQNEADQNESQPIEFVPDSLPV
ncbi:hypothetical protein DH2020_003718 [Rehmannia glutinosa]|uniref:Uncharacterized protein n=1 Tax=Rehmannia glutinosa TaxID=99300 RepID=A0ABR0XME0_REHGL